MPASCAGTESGVSVRDVLTDYLGRGLVAVFVGTSVATVSAKAGHYYSHPQNRFWELLRATGLLGDDRLGPEDDHRVLDYGIGLTDVVKGRAESSDARLRPEDFGPARFVGKILDCHPKVVAFNGEKAATIVARHLRQPRMRVDGPATWTIGESRIYRLPSSSPSAASIGRDNKMAAWMTFGEWVRALDG